MRNCPDVTILNSPFGLCLLSFCLICPFFFLSFYLFVFLPFCLFVFLPFCLFVFLSLGVFESMFESMFVWMPGWTINPDLNISPKNLLPRLPSQPIQEMLAHLKTADLGDEGTPKRDLGRVFERSWRYPGGILEEYWRNLGRILEVSWRDLGRLVSWRYLERILGHWYPGGILEVS